MKVNVKNKCDELVIRGPLEKRPKAVRIGDYGFLCLSYKYFLFILSRCLSHHLYYKNEPYLQNLHTYFNLIMFICL